MHARGNGSIGLIIGTLIIAQNVLSQDYTSDRQSDTSHQSIESSYSPSLFTSETPPESATTPVNPEPVTAIDDSSAKSLPSDDYQWNFDTDSMHTATAATPPAPVPPPAPASDQKEQPATTYVVQPERPFTMGIGFQCGIRFHRPEGLNDFITDIWNAYIAKKVYTPVDEKTISPGVLLSLNGTFDIGQLFQATPFIQGMWAGKLFQFRGDPVGDIYFNTYTTLGGVNLWIRVIRQDRFAIRLGAGSYATYSFVKLTGDVSHARVSGGGYGFRGLLGSELRLNAKTVLTFDCSVPYGKTRFHTKEWFSITGIPIYYPAEYRHFGIEVCPGIMFYF